MWLRKKLGNSFDAADLAHDTFVRLISARRHDAGPEPRALLTHIAKGLVVDHWRRRALEEAYLAAIARSEEHTSELQSLMRISYAVFCLQKKTKRKPNNQ